MNSAAQQAVDLLQEVIEDPTQLSALQILELTSVCVKLQPVLRQTQLNQPDLLDPRFALALSAYAESLAAEALRTQVHTASLVEASSAHCWAFQKLDTLRNQLPDLSEPPQLA